MLQALTDLGVAARTTLQEQWDTWLAQPAAQTMPPPAEREPPPVASPRACGAALLRWVVALWTGGPLVLGIDASLRRDEVVLLRTSVRSRGTAIPVAWVIVPANQSGAWLPHLQRMLAWLTSVVPVGQQVLVVADRGLWSPKLWDAIRSHGWHPVLRIQSASTFAPTGQPRQSITTLVGGPGRGWSGTGVAFKHAPKRITGTFAAVWDEGQDEVWG